jgi:hypothetical protein
MADLCAAEDLVIDRFYRGAIVALRGASVALGEPAIALVEKVLRGGGGYVPAGDDERALAEALLERGILCRRGEVAR